MRRAVIFSTILLLAALFFAPVIWALDFGGSIENETSYLKAVDPLFTQEDKFQFWASADLGKNFQFNVTASATLSTLSPLLFADVERLSLTGTFQKIEQGPNLFAFEAGRFQHYDFTQRIFAQALDGIKFDFTYPSTRFQFAFGYTGLINKYYSTPIMGKEDALADVETGAIFANPKLIGSFSMDFPELFARQTLVFSILVQEDLRPLFKSVLAEGRETIDPGRGGKLDTQYLGAGLSGPLVSDLYYDLYAYVGTGRTLVFENDAQSSTGSAYKYEPIMGFLFGGSFRYYIPQFMQSLAIVRYMYASGDPNQTAFLEGNTGGTVTAFMPVSGATYGLAFIPKSSNIMVIELGYSLKPFAGPGAGLIESLQTGLKVTPFFKPVKGPISEPAVKATGDAGYLGTEFAAVAAFRPFSDLGLSLSLGGFMPNASAFSKGGDSLWFLGKFLFSFSY